jgi:hypothetical protein
MYLTAQHVISPVTHREGVNAYYYSHGNYLWDHEPPPGIPDADPGALMNQLTPIPPGGNRVRSYLDVVAPDETTWTEIRQGFVSFVGESQRLPLPWQAIRGRCLFRLGMESGLTQRWQLEIADLYRALQDVRS